MSRTDKILTSIDEKFFDAMIYSNNIVNIYVNPTLQELKGIKTIRFIAIARTKKEIYAWDAGLALHSHVNEKYKLKSNLYSDTIWGLARKEGNKWVYDSSDTLEGLGESKIKILMKKDWKWLDYYIRDMSDRLKELSKPTKISVSDAITECNKIKVRVEKLNRDFELEEMTPKEQELVKSWKGVNDCLKQKGVMESKADRLLTIVLDDNLLDKYV